MLTHELDVFVTFAQIQVFEAFGRVHGSVAEKFIQIDGRCQGGWIVMVVH